MKTSEIFEASELYTTHEIAKATGINEERIRKAVKEEHLVPKVGGIGWVAFLGEEVNKWIKNYKQNLS